jgi:hypothetical protein
MRSSFIKILMALAMTVQLASCGGGGGNGADSAAVFTESSVASEVTASRATLAWVAPVARADASPLSLAEIGGYRVYYGTIEGDYPNRIDIADGSADQVTLTDLPSGTYYFVVTTYDMAGRESEYSSELVKTI